MRGERGFAMRDTGLTPRKIEQILRDAGVSKSVARAIVARGWQGADDADAVEAEALCEKLKDAAARLKGFCEND
jgi:hypothetical protein